ncbi:MAG: hypothetical protein R2867_22345 [Caldilineaceae bacterium]
MSLITALLLTFFVLINDALTSQASFVQRWLSGCLISVTVLVSIVGGIAGLVFFSNFLFNL